ncbi:aldose epimerase family protein [Fulvimonas soli]|jgi:aldose 1-epimerase|uniref:Aldose 1-epimerase n=1 Tax=Fulvimonas soli TaxID=155197 RepID=A0A316IFQ9_9GAMM|nr:aldose epimerase family protein [Fulvimonas soli]PWK92427.1 aldose 1-epimerase [Fulvimonas soli]TNY25488.1 galactose mutarotase [Fulvimonas soli]
MRRAALIGSILGLAALASAAQAADARRETFGRLPDGTRVEAVVLDNGHGMTARVLALGASLQSLSVPGRDGKAANVVLGYATLDGYLKKPQYFGATVGRYANRIAGGRFTLDGKAYQVPVNDGPNSLHGGTRGFDKALWTIGEVRHDAGKASVTLSYASPDGEMGYPGRLAVTATYTLDDANRLSIDYRATTDKPTIVNLSNHAYWNLAGEGSGSVMGQRLTIPADAYLPVDATAIPTGEIRKVDGTPFDFRRGKPIGRDIRVADQQLLNGRGYDHNWVISRAEAAAPRVVARVEDPASGRVLTLKSAQPGLQFYSGNFLDGTTVGTGGHVYRQGDAFVLEPQLYPDTPNRPAFGSARLEPGHVYRNLIVYEFTTGPARGAR